MKYLLFTCIVIIFSNSVQSQSYKWQQTNGPTGCDATSFYMDMKGNYWLGTGSSGGVYFSKNKGTTWEARNKGIGPVHIEYIGNVNDTVFIQISDMKFGRDGVRRYFRWDSRKKEWCDLSHKGTILKDSGDIYKYYTMAYRNQNIDSVFMNRPETLRKIKYIKENPDAWMYFDTVWMEENNRLDSIFVRNARENDYIQKIQNPVSNSMRNGTWFSYIDYLSGDWGVYPYTVGWGAGFGGVWEGREAMHIIGFDSSVVDLLPLNAAFPRDMFKIPAGNIFDGGKGTKVLLAKSGIYHWKSNQIEPLPTTGMCATDVRQIVSIGSRLVVLVGESEIWEYQNNVWKRLFSAWEHYKTDSSWYSVAGFDIRQLNALPDGNILFCFCGEAWQIDKEGNTTKIIEIANIPDDTSRLAVKQQIYYTSISRDNKGNYWAVGFWRYYSSINDYRDNPAYYQYSMVLLRIPERNSFPEIIKEMNDRASGGNQIYCFTFNDKAGGVWYRSGKEIRQIGFQADTTLVIPMYGNQWLSSIAFQNDGSFSFINENYDSTLFHYNYVFKRVEEILIPRLDDMKSLGYDKNNTLWAGTGKEYSFSCGNGMYGHARGLFKFEKGKWINIGGEPNKWILSIGSGYEGEGIPIGTSGSGLLFIKD